MKTVEKKIKLKTSVAMKCSRLEKTGLRIEKSGKEGKRVRDHLSKRGKVAAIFTVMLLVITLMLGLLPKATAATTITSIDPESGHIGDVVRVLGEIDTSNGSYAIFFDEEEVKNGTAAEQAVNDTFIVPYRPIGNYNVTLQDATTKSNYTFPISFAVKTAELTVYLQTRNKYDKEPLGGVLVEAYVDETYVTYGITNETGLTSLQVSHGNYTFKALWAYEEVGSLNYTVLENATVPPLECELAHLTVTVKDEAGFPLPFINVTLTSNKTGVLQSETNSTGIVTTNTFTNVSYTIEAWRYGHLFGSTQIANLTVTRWIDITCPTYTLFVNVVDSKGIPLRNVEVAVYEWSSGVAEPIQSETTDDSGSAVFNFTFGRYKIWVYNDDHTIILNKTVVDLTEDQLFFVVHCKIFNIDLSVIVKDYFGHPISNALVEVERDGTTEHSQKTGSNGIADFLNVTGGDCQISVSVMKKVSETRSLYLDETTHIVFKLEKFVAVGGFLLEVTQLIAYISIGSVIVLFALALTYRRLRLRRIPEEEKEKTL